MTGVIEKFEGLERAAQMHMKGFTDAEIARELEITPATVKGYIREYKGWIKERADHDPDFLDRLAENTIQALDEINLIYKEAWQAHETAKEFEMMSHIISSLKLLKEIAESKSKLLQLAGAKADGSQMAHLKRIEQVNDIISGVLKEVIRECPRCAPEVRIKLAEAFDVMGKGDEAFDAESEEIEDAELII